MRAGFHLYYQREDGAYLCLQLAKYLHNQGYDIDLFPIDKPQLVHPFWDRHLVKPGKGGFNSWLDKAQLTHLIFADPPDPGMVEAAKARGIRTYLTVLWTDIEEDDLAVLPMFDKIICPARVTERLLQEGRKLTNLVYLPWDPGVPITRDVRVVDSSRVGLFWPMTGSQSFHQEPDVVPVLEAVLDRHPGAYLTVSYASTIGAKGTALLRKLHAAGSGRVELCKNLSWEKEQLLYGRHDLTVWPSLVESLGLVGLTSVHMGTPVIAFDHPLIGEFVKGDKNGVLVPCELSVNWLGVPYVEADYKSFAETLDATLSNDRKLSRMRETVTYGLRNRRSFFNDVMSNLFT